MLLYILRGLVLCNLERAIREILLLGHRQAFAWIDEWYGMTEEDVRVYEAKMQAETNEKVLGAHEEAKNSELGEEATEEAEEAANSEDVKASEPTALTSTQTALPGNGGHVSPSTNPAASAVAGLKSWLNWG